MDIAQRRVSITNLYQVLLGREPDEAGLDNYITSTLTLGKIESVIRASDEYVARQRKVNFMGSVDAIGSDNKLLMGSCPTEERHVEELKRSGVKAILNLDDMPYVEYDFTWCEDYLQIPLSTENIFSTEDVERCLNFLYTNIRVNGYKTLVHSRDGLNRAPIMILMYLIGVAGLSFKESLGLVLHKQPQANPEVSKLINSGMLRYLKNYNDRVSDGLLKKTSESLQKISNGVYVGTSLTVSNCFQLSKENVKTIINFDTNPLSAAAATEHGFEITSLPISSEGTDDDLYKSLEIIIKTVKSSLREGKRVFLYSTDEIMVSLVSMAFLVDKGDSFDKAAGAIESTVPTILSTTVLKEWKLSR